MVRVHVVPPRAAVVACSLALLVVAMVLPAVAGADPDTGAPTPADPGQDVSEPWLGTSIGDVRAVATGVVPFVAVGSEGFPPTAAAWSSVDGREWLAATVADAPLGSTLTAVIPLADGLVAFGHESMADGGEADRLIAWHSSDGITWDPAAIERPAKGGMQAVVADAAVGPAGGLVLGSFIGQDIGRQRLWHSSDGMAWTPVALPGTRHSIWSSLAGLMDGYLLMGQTANGRVSNWRSSDGLSWTRVKDSPRMFDVATSPDGATVGIGAKAIYSSPDLRSWARVWTRPKSWALQGSNAFDWIAWDGSEFLVVGHDLGSCAPDIDECHLNPLLVSTDGQTWVEAAGPDGVAGADPGTWLEGSASSAGTTIIEGQADGSDVVWLVQEPLTSASTG